GQPVWEDLLCAGGERRDAAAFAALSGHFPPRVESLMIRHGLPPDAAAEVAQEALIAIWRRAAPSDPTKPSARAWLCAIARDPRIDRLRKEARPEPDPDAPAFTPDPPDGAERALDGRQRAARVRAAIAALPEAQREVLVRSYFADRTHVEIAAELQTPVGTVKSRLRLALARLGAALRADGLDEGA